MENLKNFINKTMLSCGILGDLDELTIEQTRNVINELNRFLYTNYEGIGTTFELGEYREYFSEFHKLWERHHRDILNPKINDEKCEAVADRLHHVFCSYPRAFTQLYETFNLTPEEICKLRFFSASQDFRGSRDFSYFVDLYKSDNSIFSLSYIAQSPESFIKEIGATNLSQSDKRVQYAKKSAEFLLERGIEPFNLLDSYNNNLVDLRECLTNNVGMGFGNKKADMFLRDMILLNVWTEYSGFEDINVASDVNTIKIALRTGILQTEIPLLSSFLDIFCYQYSLIDEMSSNAWRRVWEIWNNKYPNQCIQGPCLIDYFIYRVVGKEFCKSSLILFQGESCGHVFKWHSAKNKKCQICVLNGDYPSAKVIGRKLPCSDPDGQIAIKNIIGGKFPELIGMVECPFIDVCNSREEGFILKNPPKSISICGRTGWSEAYARENEGGGGLMA